MERLEVLHTRRGGRLRLVGEIDMSNADGLAAILRAEGEKSWELKLDLSDVTFMDSSGLQVLLDLSTSQALVIVRPSEAVRRLFEVAIPHGAAGLEIRS